MITFAILFLLTFFKEWWKGLKKRKPPEDDFPLGI